MRAPSLCSAQADRPVATNAAFLCSKLAAAEPCRLAAPPPPHAHPHACMCTPGAERAPGMPVRHLARAAHLAAGGPGRQLRLCLFRARLQPRCRRQRRHFWTAGHVPGRRRTQLGVHPAAVAADAGHGRLRRGHDCAAGAAAVPPCTGGALALRPPPAFTPRCPPHPHCLAPRPCHDCHGREKGRLRRQGPCCSWHAAAHAHTWSAAAVCPAPPVARTPGPARTSIHFDTAYELVYQLLPPAGLQARYPFPARTCQARRTLALALARACARAHAHTHLSPLRPPSSNLAPGQFTDTKMGHPSGVSHASHAGGFLAGLLVSFPLLPDLKARRAAQVGWGGVGWPRAEGSGGGGPAECCFLPCCRRT